ncbi:MAG TPA: orotidine-5'-phosphate decarboxylase [Candidatus Hydrogenedentes bacterium]|nr:orotidine-5'-phosphate decarboxylase [Candidatus Hydrogenedentota bacterium]HOV76036.1 orotidine-5'-phosphate decarboxylase [Candidatus Hydrogenedentota bacterium]HPC18234.1 orotidine-5'-phosphate decarboxylase [Candidatus Hydrogenedentota bacterium]HRT21898.1 orotidine-5'-phosphate decarboxylase [Candidatus Hydrogenedentota bacterium]HRT66640.1 orotidine-5'-phosphate decarboxylase [Candidatus Hydrogenedentota bacterium]
MQTELITVLDMDSREEALHAVDLCGTCQYFKIGSQLFTRCGPAIVQEILGKGKNVFLDLKFHDIPNTVAKAARGAADLGVALFTLHAMGGRRMIEAAREAVEGTNTKILAVTVLTSLSDEMLRDEVGLPETTSEAVVRLAKQSVESGAHGIVSSPQETALVREAVGLKPVLVTPGIRPAWSTGKDDQLRITTPRQAAEAGANFIVVGRPIFKHENPAEAVRLIQEELA